MLPSWIRPPWVTVAIMCGLALGQSGDSAHAASTRAYELIAPEHQGFPTGVGPGGNAGNQGVWIDPSGSRIAYGSADPFLGASGLPATYLSTRGTERWSTVGLFPHFLGGSLMRSVQTTSVSDTFDRLYLTADAALSPDDINGTPDVYVWDVGANKLTWLSESTQAGRASYDGRSLDGRQVVFTSDKNLVPEAGGAAPKVYEQRDGRVTLVSSLPGGDIHPSGASLGSRDSLGIALSQPVNAVSSDGSVIFFSAPPLAASMPGDVTKLFARLDGSSTVAIAESQCSRLDCNDPSDSVFASATPTGSHVFFSTKQQLVDSDIDEKNDLYGYQLETQTLTRLSEGYGAALPSAADTIVLGSANDGTRVYFRGLNNELVLWDHGVLKLLADRIGGEVGPDQDCAQAGSGRSGSPQLTEDGGVIVFSTSALVADGSSIGPGLYAYDVGSDSLTPISAGGSLIEAAGAGYAPDCMRRRSISGDGRRIFFDTAEPLVPSDANGQRDVYEWRDGDLSLLSSGTGDRPSVLLGIARDGDDVFFTTSDKLVAEDRDDVQDIYDARANGFKASMQGAAACGPADCRESFAERQTNSEVGSSRFNGRGNKHRPGRARAHIKRIARQVQEGRLEMIVRIDTPGALTIVARVASKGRRVVVGRMQRSVGKRGDIRVKLALSPWAQARLAERRALSLTITAGSAKSVRTQRIVAAVKHG